VPQKKSHFNFRHNHRRTSQEAGGAAAHLTPAKQLFFGLKLIFFGQKPAAKNKKNVFSTRKNGIHSV